MAEGGVESVEFTSLDEMRDCIVCERVYSAADTEALPRLLQCTHTVCQQCLLLLIQVSYKRQH